MKKTLVALAVMAVAGSANASIELYNKDGVTANLKGDIEVRYKKGFAKDGAKHSDAELTQEVDDADFAFDLRYAVNDDLQVGGFFEVQDTGSKTGDAYIGFYSASMGDIVFGRTATILDDLGIGSDYLFGVTSKVDNFDFSGDEVVKYTLDKGQFYGGIAFLQNKSADHEKLKDADSSHVDAKLGARFGDLDVQGFFGKTKGVKTGGDLTILALEGAYTIDALKLEASFSQGKLDESGSTVKTNIVGAAATYTMDAWTFGAGLSNSKADTDGADAVNNSFINAGYALTSNVTAYAEVGFTTAKDTEDKNGTGYGFGVKASF
ncbi:porin [Vibrio penaeicida]|uniref:Outer membrane protein n=1 Tax=Vibrio penaeicida TaxID=104609 RepID=A0AAV5NNC7_9VIBR|nr:porin [Vibrio penaeicida]RTZ22141.1 porin [Vibrio penaeicida]GLQ71697.1 outer membrane protein [Vibrio penaeicida]